MLHRQRENAPEKSRVPYYLLRNECIVCRLYLLALPIHTRQVCPILKNECSMIRDSEKAFEVKGGRRLRQLLAASRGFTKLESLPNRP